MTALLFNPTARANGQYKIKDDEQITCTNQCHTILKDDHLNYTKITSSSPLLNTRVKTYS
jgi:hypothetical protein